MIKTILFLVIFVILAFGQQTNFTYGQQTDGTEYTATGIVDVDSITTVSIVIDFQDYYRATDDTYGVLFYYFDAEAGTDSVNFWINWKNGGRIYDANDGNRVTTANIGYSSDTTAVVALSQNLNDVSWTSAELVVSGQMFPPEFGKFEIKFNNNSNDNLDVQFYFVFQSVYEEQQQKRSTSSSSNARKSGETLH